MASGIGVDDTCLTDFSNLKIRKTHTWIVFKIDDSATKIVVLAKGNGDKKEFINNLPAKDCRYGVFDSEASGKIVFVMWAPDDSPVKPRMMYASSKDALMKKLDGVAGTALEAHDYSDLNSL